jgi:hypothetical protein
VINQNDFDKALKRIDAESSDYYVLGYYSSNPDPLKRTRKIDVKVRRPGVDVWARKSYSVKAAAGTQGAEGVEIRCARCARCARCVCSRSSLPFFR